MDTKYINFNICESFKDNEKIKTYWNILTKMWKNPSKKDITDFLLFSDVHYDPDTFYDNVFEKHAIFKNKNTQLITINDISENWTNDELKQIIKAFCKYASYKLEFNDKIIITGKLHINCWV